MNMLLSISSSPVHLHPFPSPFLPRSKTVNPTKSKPFICKAELIHDAPFALALGACVITSVVSPADSGEDSGDGAAEHGGAMDSTDTRLAVMAIISLVPYFNWLGWVFAWMDSGKQRYLVYALVYLAPYLRTNFSLSPEESWLPIASILICILHIQLETSIKNGDLDEFQIPFIRKKEARVKRTVIKGRGKREKKLPSANESKDKLRDWGVFIDETEKIDENSNDKFI